MMLYCYWVSVLPQFRTNYPQYCHHDAGMDKHHHHSQPTPAPPTTSQPREEDGGRESVAQYHNGKVTRGNRRDTAVLVGSGCRTVDIIAAAAVRTNCHLLASRMI